MKKRLIAWILSIVIVLTTVFSGECLVNADVSTDKSTVTVYFTLSEDGQFVTGNDENETVLAHVPVTISYYDLAEYGMEDFYRYEADSFENGGEYIGTEVIEQPTLLHLFIKMLEEYYLADGTDLIVNDGEQDALSISGSPTSLYMTRFWGHDENLMYYVDHKYPLQASGWGSTSDYILLEDGMEIDVAMFSDWDFYHTGAFAYFTGNGIESSAPSQFDISVDQEISLTMRATATNAAYDGNSSFSGQPMGGETVVYCRSEQAVADYTNDNWQQAEEVTDENGNITLSFSEPGTYYVSSTSLYENFQLSSGNACVAPPIAVINVTGDSEKESDTEIDYQGKLVSGVTFSNGVSAVSPEYKLDSEFANGQKEYIVTIPDYESNVCIKAQLYEAAPERTSIKVSYCDTEGVNRELNITGNDALGKKLTRLINEGIDVNTLTLEAVCENSESEDVTEIYQFDVKRQLSLADISINNEDSGNEIILSPSFNRGITEYTANITANTKSINLNVQAFQNADYEILVNNQTPDNEGNISISFNDDLQETIVIVVNYPQCAQKTYTITVNKTGLVSAEIQLMQDSVIQVENSSGEKILRYKAEDSSYVLENLSEGQEYTYTITKYGYNALTGSFIAQSGLRINGVLTKAADNETIDMGIAAQWSNFRGNNNNNGITGSLTPTDYTNAQLYWAKKVGTGFGSGAPSSPILVDDCLVYTTATTIVKVDTITGEVIASGNMIRTSAFNITPPTYADGMIFVALASGTIQAFNAETLESLWVYQDSLFGQPNSPISYCDGYIYTGFWNGETGNANYVCLSVTDENINDETESKTATWTYKHKGGFYWAGSYACSHFVVVGTDDGSMSGETGNSSVLVFDPLTGNVIDRYDEVKGDTRSTICFDEETGRYYFTSKGGGFYAMEISQEGTIQEVESIDLGSSSTSTPVVHNGRAYVGVKGEEQFGVNSGHHIAVIDLNDMDIAYTLATRGYPQTSGIATIGYEEQDGYTYVYFVDNYEPGKIRVLKDKPGQTQAIITRDSEYEDENDYNVLFSPKGEQANYAICSLIADEYGTLYFKNDSAYMMALGSKITKIEVTKQPDKVNYKVGETFDASGMVVTASYANGTTRDITKYVTYDSKKLTADMSDVEIRFEYVAYNDELATYESFEPLIDTVNITVNNETAISGAQEVVSKIDAIDTTITLDSKEKIKAARKAYDSLSSSLEQYVTNYTKLTTAEKAYSQLITKYFSEHKVSLVVSLQSYQKVLIQWQTVSYADGYIVYRKEKKTGTYKEIYRTTAKSYTDTTVLLGTKYYYKVLPYVTLGEWDGTTISGVSGEVSITPLLKAPKGIKLKVTKKKTVRIRWKKVSKASGYVIYRSKKKSGKYKKIKVIKSGSVKVFKDKKVKTNKKYFYKVRAYRTVNGKKVYGKYSVCRKIKVKG